MKLVHKISLAIALIIFGLVSFVHVSLTTWISRETHRRLDDDLGRTLSILDTLHRSQLDRLAILCGSVAEAPRFRAAISEEDPATVADQAAEEKEVVGCDLLLVAGSRGQLLAWIGPEGKGESVLADPRVVQGRSGHDGAGFWVHEERLYQVAVRAIRYGEDIAGVLMIGALVDDGDAQQFERLTHTDLLYILPDGRPAASTLPLADRAGIASAATPLESRRSFEIRSGARRLKGVAERIAGSPVGVVLLEDLDAALAYLGEIQRNLLVMGILAFLVSLIISMLLVSTITTPVAALVRGVEAVGQGDYDQTIPSTTADEIGFLARRFDAMRLRLKESIARLKEAERVQRDLELARQIQSSLLPDTPPRVAGAEVHGICVPANEVGGDYFDHMMTPDHLDLIVADVSGHSVGSALMMAMSRSVLRAMVSAGREPAEVLDAANRLMFDDLVRANLFFSGFVGRYYPMTRQFRFASAGHNPPLWVRAAEQRCERLEADGMLVGLMPEVEFGSVDIVLEENDLVVLYTDGIIEATAGGDEMYGEERLVQVLLRSAQLSPSLVAKAVLDDLRGWMGSVQAGAGDDLTLLILKVLPPSSVPSAAR